MRFTSAVPLLVLTACAIGVAGCGGSDTTAPPPAQAPPAPATPSQPVALEDADVPPDGKDAKPKKPTPPPLPNGKRSKWLPKAEQKKVVAAFFTARTMCRRKRSAIGRVLQADTLKEFTAVKTREESRLTPNVQPFVDAAQRLVKAFKATPNGAVNSARGPHTLIELFDMLGDSLAHDCESDEGAQVIDKYKRGYGRKYIK